MPSLITLYNRVINGQVVNTFYYPERVILESLCVESIPCVDIPSLTTVVLSDRAFSCKKDIRVHSRVTLVGLSADVSEALLQYLSSVSCKDMGC